MPRRSTPLDAAGCTRSRQPARRDVRSRRVRGQVRVLVVMFFSRGQQPEENTTLLASLLRTSSTSHSHLMILFFILVKKKKDRGDGTRTVPFSQNRVCPLHCLPSCYQGRAVPAPCRGQPSPGLWVPCPPAALERHSRTLLLSRLCHIVQLSLSGSSGSHLMQTCSNVLILKQQHQ